MVAAHTKLNQLKITDMFCIKIFQQFKFQCKTVKKQLKQKYTNKCKYKKPDYARKHLQLKI